MRTGPELPSIRADRGQLEQVLVNLAVNARDAMATGGMLTIETDIVDLDADSAELRSNLRPGRYVTLSVSDTGTGMSAEVIAHAFEPFFSTKPQRGGIRSGLGHGVRNRDRSRWKRDLLLGRWIGTTVRVYLPAVDQAAPARGAGPSAMLQKGGGETIVVVEDEEAMREVALRILRRNGYEVLGAASGHDALGILETHTCDLLLTDVIMPQMSGRDLVNRVHATQPNLPILYMSGYSQGVLGPQRALDDSVALIQKPFGELALLEKVHAILHPAT